MKRAVADLLKKSVTALLIRVHPRHQRSSALSAFIRVISVHPRPVVHKYRETTEGAQSTVVRKVQTVPRKRAPYRHMAQI
jgi:hypothetical protein